MVLATLRRRRTLGKILYQVDGWNWRLSFDNLADAEPLALVNLIGFLHGFTQTSAKRRDDENDGTTVSIVLQSFKLPKPRPDNSNFILGPG